MKICKKTMILRVTVIKTFESKPYVEENRTDDQMIDNLPDTEMDYINFHVQEPIDWLCEDNLIEEVVQPQPYLSNDSYDGFYLSPLVPKNIFTSITNDPKFHPNEDNLIDEYNFVQPQHYITDFTTFVQSYQPLAPNYSLKKSKPRKKIWRDDVLSSKKKFESWLANNQEQGFIRFYDGSFRINNDLCNKLYSGVGEKKSRQHLKRKLRDWGYGEDGETYKKFKIEENLQSNEVIDRNRLLNITNKLNDKLNLFLSVYQQFTISDKHPGDFEEYISKSSRTFLRKRMKNLILNDKMNCSNDLWELFPEEEEANNMVRKFFIGRINEHTKHDFSDTDLILYKKIHPVALRFGSNIFRIYLLLLLEKIYVKYFVEIIREPFSSDYISRGSYKFYIRNAVDEIYKPERYHFRHLHRRYLTNLKLTVDTYYDKMKWTLNFFSKYVKK